MRHHLHGPVGMLAGYSLFAVVPVLVKLAFSQGASAPVAVLLRFAVGLLCVLGMVTLTGQRIRTRNFKVLALRGLFGGTAVTCFFVSVMSTGAGPGTLLNYTHSIWGNVLAVLVFRQRPARTFWLLLVIAIAGLYLVVDPEKSLEQTIQAQGAAAGLLSGLFGGAAILCIKRLRQTDNALTIFFSFAVVSFLLALLLLSPDILWRNCAAVKAGFVWPTLGTLVLLGVVSFGGQMLFTAGYKNTSIPMGTLLSLTVPVLAVVNGHLFLSEELSFRFLVGACLILFACVGVGLVERSKREAVRSSHQAAPEGP